MGNYCLAHRASEWEADNDELDMLMKDIAEEIADMDARANLIKTAEEIADIDAQLDASEVEDHPVRSVVRSTCNELLLRGERIPLLYRAQLLVWLANTESSYKLIQKRLRDAQVLMCELDEYLKAITTTGAWKIMGTSGRRLSPASHRSMLDLRQVKW